MGRTFFIPFDAPMKIILKILNFLGVHPLKSKSFEFDWYLVYFVLIWCIYTAYIITRFVYLYTIIDDVMQFTQIAYLNFIELMAEVKTWYLIKKMKTLKDFTNSMNLKSFQPKNETQHQYANEYTSFIKKVTFGYYTFANIVCVLLLIIPILNGTAFKYKVLPGLSWIPFNYKHSPYFELVYLHQFIALNIISQINVTSDCLVTYSLAFLALQVDLLKNSLENLHQQEENESLDVQEVLDRSLRKCIKHHQDIIAFSRKLSDVANVFIFGQYATSVITFCCTLFILSVITPFSVQFYVLIIYQLACYCELGLYTWFGNEVTYKSNELPYSALKSDWYKGNINFKKKLMFFVMRTQRPIIIYAIGFFPLSMEAFVAMIRTSFSYFTLLQRIGT